MNNTDYVSLETAKLLLEAGYNYICETYYDTNNEFRITVPEFQHNCPMEPNFNDMTTFIGYENYKHVLCSAPILYDSQKWLREEHKIYIEILCGVTMSTKSKVIYDYTIKCNTDGYQWGKKVPCGKEMYSTYEQALDEAIREACKMIINDKK